MSETPETPNLTPPVMPIETPVTPAPEPTLLSGETAEPKLDADGKPIEEKPAEPEAPVAVEPLTAEALTIPEGMEVSEELRDEFLKTVNDPELSAADRANALLSLQAKAMTAASEASSAAWNTLQDQWRSEVKTAYGDNLQPTLNSINRLISEHGDDKLTEALAYTGAGNNPQIIGFLAKLAGILTEGSAKPGTPSGSDKTAAQRLFPSMQN